MNERPNIATKGRLREKEPTSRIGRFVDRTTEIILISKTEELIYLLALKRLTQHTFQLFPLHQKSCGW